MRTGLLITLEDFEPYKGVTGNLPAIKVLQPHILMAQQLDVQPILGDAFFVDLLDNVSTTKYQDLLNGKNYVNSLGHTVYFQGLKAVIVMYAYARYILNKNITDTPFGMVHKTNEYSQQSEDKTLVRLANQAQSQAKAYELQVLKFLCEDNGATYPLFIDTCRKPNGRGFARISGIGAGDSRKETLEKYPYYFNRK